MKLLAVKFIAVTVLSLFFILPESSFAGELIGGISSSNRRYGGTSTTAASRVGIFRGLGGASTLSGNRYDSRVFRNIEVEKRYEKQLQDWARRVDKIKRDQLRRQAQKDKARLERERRELAQKAKEKERLHAKWRAEWEREQKKLLKEQGQGGVVEAQDEQGNVIARKENVNRENGELTFLSRKPTSDNAVQEGQKRPSIWTHFRKALVGE